jgi:hypothetical protein
MRLVLESTIQKRDVFLKVTPVGLVLDAIRRSSSYVPSDNGPSSAAYAGLSSGRAQRFPPRMRRMTLDSTVGIWIRMGWHLVWKATLTLCVAQTAPSSVTAAASA